jgi:hypothetical protein
VNTNPTTTPFWERHDEPGTDTRWVTHLHGSTLTARRMTVDKRTGTVTGPVAPAVASPTFASRQPAPMDAQSAVIWATSPLVLLPAT